MVKKTLSNKKKVLVTGAGGFLGSCLCQELLKNGYFVIGLVFGKKDSILKLKKEKNIRFVETDITDYEKVFKVLKKYRPEGIFHTAALLPRAGKGISSLPYFKVNATGTLHLLEACRILNIRKFVYSSSMSVYGQNIKYLPVDEVHPVSPRTFYGLSKRQGEEFAEFYARNHNLGVIILRYAGIYGVGREDGVVANFLRSALSGKPLRIISDTGWDIVYVKDVAKANISAFENINKGLEIINIGSGEEIKVFDLAKEIIENVRSESEIEKNKSLPRSHFFFNIKKAKKFLDFKPLSIKKGLEAYIKDATK